MASFTIELTENKTLLFRFKDYWECEDIPELQQHISLLLAGYQLIENVLGADRQYMRFEWQSFSYILQFESYGQSCWLESDASDESIAIETIHQYLLNKN